MSDNTTLMNDPWSTASSQPPTTAAPLAESDPWASTSTPATAVADDPWAASSTGTQSVSTDAAVTAPAPAASTDWLSSAATPEAADHSSLWQQWWTEGIPIQDGINQGLSWVVEHFRPFFQAVRTPIDTTLTGVTDLLQVVPWPIMVVLVALFAWQFASLRLAIGSGIALAAVALIGIWPEAMVTLALVLTSLLFCVVIGLPVGILLASSDRAQRWMRPLLDAMQTTPAFVYLVPVVMLFGIGNVPGVIVTIVFALPPLIRLTNLGLRQVRPDLIEASRAYGASPWQLLWKVQLPLAMPSIMTGINQALMLSLSMVVIASMIAVGGLGQMVLRGIGRLDMGLATVGGLGIVLLAIVLDRLTQSVGQQTRGHTPWWHTGPLGLLLRPRQAPTETAATTPSGTTPSVTAQARRAQSSSHPAQSAA